MISLLQEYHNGLIQSKLRESEKNMNALKNLKMMKLLEENLMPKKKFFNKNNVKSNLTKLKKCSTITKTWLKLCIARC